MRPLKKLTILIGFGLIGVLLYSSRAEAFIFQDRISVAKSLAHYAMGQMYDLLGLPNRSILEYEKAVQFLAFMQSDSAAKR